MSHAQAALSLWLDRLSLGSVLNNQDRAAVLGLPGRLDLIKPNRDFVRLGETVDHTCLIASGLAGRFGQMRNGDRQITALHLPGNMADLDSVVMPQPGSGLVSIGQTLIYRVPLDAICALAAASHGLAEAFWRECTMDSAMLSQWNVANSRLPADGRVAHIMCELCCRFAYGICEDGFTIDWHMSQVNLAEITGLTAVHVNRMLRKIREKGAAEIRSHRLRVLDWNRLTAMAEFDPRYLALETISRPRTEPMSDQCAQL